ncbi:hypothetical protein [Streptomyces sp. NBC_01465]|uniref:hypothetical protein n=1 Tax=Streptomyces sp. NBC_01465 TaxID=2903878 RepID=UPI002E335784|nr:hypothetical protein [Streptomyces sp. NBC_01465]
MRVARTPNPRLRALLGESGWTGQALADAVNAAAAEAGTRLHYDRTAVAHWLSGTCPPAPVAGFVAEVLSRRTRREVTVDDTGLARTSGHCGVPGSAAAALEDIVAPLEELAGRRAVLRSTVYSLAATQLPSFAQLPPPVAESKHRTEGLRIDGSHVRTATLMLGVFSDADTAFGGGRSRQALAAFLGTDMALWLRSGGAPGVRAQLLAAAADLTYLAGFMCFDDRLQGAAQHYYTAAARLASAAGDPARYALALRGMSVQAHELGHCAESLRLASAAVASAPPGGPRVAFFTGQLAVASAAAGDRRAALTHLASAERALARADLAGAGIGAYHQASLAHQQSETLALLGDLPRAAELLALSLRHRPPGERRSRAVTKARLAGIRLRMGHVEHACEDWRGFLDDHPMLESGRADAALRSLRRELRPYAASVPAARDVLARAGAGAR